MLDRSKSLNTYLKGLSLPSQVAFAYHPLDYAWDVYEAYVTRFAAGPKKILYIGMNPGPFGMAQTGIPFGEIQAVKNFLRLDENFRIHTPKKMHPKKPVQGWACKRSEVSGKRLWGWLKDRYQTAENCFENNFILNYCPVLFLTETGCNLTPNDLPKASLHAILEACDAHLRDWVEHLQVEHVIGVGQFASQRAEIALSGIQIHTLLHPSPANPHANRNPWAETASRQLEAMGLSAL